MPSTGAACSIYPVTLNLVLIGNFDLGGARIEAVAVRLEKAQAAMGWLPEARLGERGENGRGVGSLAASRTIVC
jgi:hypothetical protein